MFRIRVWFLSFVLSAACAASLAQTTAANYGVGSADVFMTKYQAFVAERVRSGETSLLRVDLGYVKGLSRSFEGATGEIQLDLRTGKYHARLRGFDPKDTYSLWLVDRPEPQGGITPLFNEARMVKLADVRGAAANGVLAANFPPGFTMDRVALVRGTDSRGEVVASGGVNVFQKLFFRRLDVTARGGALLLAHPADAPPALASVVPDVAAETLAAQVSAALALGDVPQHLEAPDATPDAVPLDTLISQGATLFFDGQFAGNGRTCGTCHPRSNNLTIDKAFIATLPANNPLFVAEFNPALAQLENPTLMRQFGLILENLDGLDDPTNKFVMRSVPHTFGMQTSLAQDTSLLNAPAQMTGWGGDGAPVSGSLRDFAIGAVTQHFTKSLARVEGPDFNLPSEHQLDAMEAFQLSLGRATDFNLGTLVFTDANVDAGKVIFRDGANPGNGGSCGACHGNGGAATGGQNRNFNTNIEVAVHPARTLLPTQPFPHDGGFGQALNAAGTLGNQTFNTPPIVEAADTAPFFHNNLANTLEEVIAFYTGPVFNGPLPAAFQISFNATQSEQVADFMRALNALQNIQVARRELQEILALSGNPQPEIQSRLETAAVDAADAIKVLNQGAIYPGTIAGLTTAQQNIAQARITSNAGQRNALIQSAITRLTAANTAIAQ